MTGDLFDAVLVAKRRVADGVFEFRFRRGDLSAFPEPAAGSHIDLITPAGLRRSYSLTTGADGHRGTYDIAVLHQPNGDGGSRSMHQDTKIGMSMQITAAVETFPLRPAPEYLMIAGGIGITAIRSMFHAVRRRGLPVTLVYLIRNRCSAAYLDEMVRACRPGASVMVHATQDRGGDRFDLWSVLERPTVGRVYCCASPAVLESVRLLTAHWRESRVHVENFSAAADPDAFTEPFTAIWAPSGQTVQVPADRSLLDALAGSGVVVPSSCRSGTCGSCRVRLVRGRAEHRDLILDDFQRRTQLTACVSRGAGTITIAPWTDDV